MCNFPENSEGKKINPQFSHIANTNNKKYFANLNKKAIEAFRNYKNSPLYNRKINN